MKLNSGGDRLNEDILLLACTRPAMLAGVTMEGMAINIIVTALCFLVGGSLVYFLVGIVIHLVFRAICKVDHNQFRVLFSWLNTKGRSRTKDFWSASTYTPLSIAKPRNHREMQKEMSCA